MPKKIILLDWDGTCAKGGGNNKNPNSPPFELKYMIEQLTPEYTLSVITGQPRCTAEKMKKEFRFPIDIAPEYGALIIEHNGSEFYTISDDERGLYYICKQLANELVEGFEGIIDERETIVSENIFFDSKDKFEEAIEFIKKNKKLPDGIKFQYHYEDCSINFLPKKLTKERIVSIYQNIGDILVAAGDGESDIPLLQSAKFPIVCFDENQKINAKVVAAISDKKYYHIAKRPHAYGLFDGLLEAIKEGIILG